MATQAQILANQRNAQKSTGPLTPSGKATVSRNATRLGLFALNNCVKPNEREEYEHFCHALWEDLAPASAIEEVTAAEFVRSAWRLRRCALAEESLGRWAGRIQKMFDEDKHRSVPGLVADPGYYEQSRPTQSSVDRARVQAYGIMRRAKSDLDRLQVNRPVHLPIALNHSEQNKPNLEAELPANVETAAESGSAAKQTQSVQTAA